MKIVTYPCTCVYRVAHCDSNLTSHRSCRCVLSLRSVSTPLGWASHLPHDNRHSHNRTYSITHTQRGRRHLITPDTSPGYSPISSRTDTESSFTATTYTPPDFRHIHRVTPAATWGDGFPKSHDSREHSSSGQEDRADNLGRSDLPPGSSREHDQSLSHIQTELIAKRQQLDQVPAVTGSDLWIP